MTGSDGDVANARWRVMTWNIRGAARPDLDAIADVIRTEAADVVAVQEISRGQARRLSKLLGWNHCWTRKHHTFTPLLWWLSEGLSIISGHPLGDVRAQSVSPGVSTWTYRHRVVLAATVRRGPGQLRVYNAHLASGRRADERIAQAALVATLIAEDTAPQAVVAGDLNAPDEVEVTRELRPVGLRDPGGGPTSPSIAPRQRLDYILIPEQARVVDQHEPDGGETWWALSDHIPVLVAFDAGADSL
jgi:endonuclease/exonuclease/phosphatase family metal-dependent hydrolase